MGGIDAYILLLVWLDEYPVAQRLHLQHITVVRLRAQLRCFPIKVTCHTPSKARVSIPYLRHIQLCGGILKSSRCLQNEMSLLSFTSTCAAQERAQRIVEYKA